MSQSATRLGSKYKNTNTKTTDSPARSVPTPPKQIDTNLSEQITDQRFKEQSDYIIDLLSKQITDSEKRISDKISNQIKELQNSINNTIVKVNELESLLFNAKSNITTLESEISQLKNTLADVNKQSTVTQVELNAIKTLQNAQENRTVACDSFIFGLPFLPDENLKTTFNLLCNALQIKPPTIKNIYRTRARTESKDTPILVKFHTPYDRNFVLRSIADFRKQKQRELSLLDVDLNSSNSFHMRESLTKNNYTILQHALALKKQKRLSSVYTSRGIVYVKRHLNETAEPIDCIENLDRDANSSLPT